MQPGHVLLSCCYVLPAVFPVRLVCLMPPSRHSLKFSEFSGALQTCGQALVFFTLTVGGNIV